MLKLLNCLLVLFLALLSYSCTKQCDDCSDDFSLRFKFRNEAGDEILKELDQVMLTDLNNNTIPIRRYETETDSVFLVSLQTSTNQSDTVVFFYNDNVIDSAKVNFGFQRDNDCCTNPRIVESMQVLNLEFSRLIRRDGDVYSIIVKE